MNLDSVPLEILDHVDAPERLRELVLSLALRGRLATSSASSAEKLLQSIATERESLVDAGKVRKGKVAPSPEPRFCTPANWTWCRLADVCVSITDGDHQAPPKADVGVPFLVIGNVRTGTLKFAQTRFVPSEYIAALDWIRKPRRGDILYTVVGSYGIPVPVETDEDFCVQRHIAILRPGRHVDQRFLTYLLKSKLVFDQATEAATGIAQKTVSLSGLRRIAIPLPPADEQVAIALQVEELLALCDELEAKQTQKRQARTRLNEACLDRLLAAQTRDEFAEHWQRIHDSFDLAYDSPDEVFPLRRAIMTLGVEGRLTNAGAHADVEELLGRIEDERQGLIDAKKQGGGKVPAQVPGIDADMLPPIPSHWRWRSLAEVSGHIVDGTHHTPKYVDVGVDFISAKDIKNGKISFENCRQISREEYDSLIRRCRPKPGDVLVQKSGSIGGVAVVSEERDFTLFESVALIPVVQSMNSTYLSYVVYLGATGAFGNEKRRGVAVQHLHLQDLRRLPVPVPPLGEQQRIVATVDSMLSQCDKLETLLADRASAAQYLLRSLVHALSGSTESAEPGTRSSVTTQNRQVELAV